MTFHVAEPRPGGWGGVVNSASATLPRVPTRLTALLGAGLPTPPQAGPTVSQPPRGDTFGRRDGGVMRPAPSSRAAVPIGSDAKPMVIWSDSDADSGQSGHARSKLT
jgi:hypothetical protein